jgi:hypothetical protein
MKNTHLSPNHYVTSRHRLSAFGHPGLAVAALMLVLSSLASWATTFVWDCSAVTPTSGSDANIVSAAFSATQGNNLGTTTLITTSSASSGYTGASGTYNFGAACKSGALSTATSTYFEVTVTPATGYAITLSSLSFGERSTSTGPQALTVYSSIDSYATAIGSATAGNAGTWALKTISFSGSSLTGAAGAAVTLRIYGSGVVGSPSSGTANWRIDDVNLMVTAAGAATAPSVTSSAATSIGAATATLNGNVTSDGGASITDRGFCYKTSSGVTISNNKTTVSGTTGAFTLTPTLAVNTHYYFVAYGINSVGTTLSSPELNFWTLANTPSAPTVANPTSSSLDVAITATDGNPSTTEYAIYETSQSKYIQAGGVLGASAVFQTAATWGTKTVTGLSPSTSYTFEVKARNGANTETGFGSTTSLSTAAAATPTITVTGGPLSFGNMEQNAASSEQSVSVSGTSLTADISVGSPAGFEISATSGSGFSSSPITLTQSGGAVGGTTIYVRFKPTAVQAYSGNLACTSTGATERDVALSGTGVYSSGSDVIADSGFSYPQNIAYGNSQETDVTSSSPAVAQFVLRDGGSSADADSADTTLTAITFNVANSANLRRVALYDGTAELGEVAVGATATFTGLSVAAPDGGTKTLTVRASFQSTVTDNQQFSFSVSSATASTSGSSFAAANAGGAASSTIGDNNRIAVTATKLVFSTVPSSVTTGQNFALTVQAQDANNNVDLDSAVPVTVSKASGSGTLSSATGLTLSLASGAKTWTDVQIDTSGTFTIQATDGSLTTATSGNITASALLLEEEFNYTAGELVTAHGWTAHSGAGSNPIKVQSPGLSYTGYVSSGVGLAASMPTSGEDDNKTFPPQTSGSVYAAFMVSASAATTGGDYFFHFFETSSLLDARVFIKKDSSSSSFAFGLSKANETATYTGFSYGLNTTCLVVVKYTFNTGTTTDDTVSLYINPAPGGSEPAATIGPLTGAAADAASLVAVALRQGGASSAPSVFVDGIRVAKTWADVVACTPPTAYSVTGGGTYCSGGAGVAIGLANSETGVSYQLYRSNGGSPLAIGSPASGTTGSAIDFGTQQYVEDTYTVVASRSPGACTASMNGSAVVTVLPSPTTSGISGSSSVAIGQAGVVYSVTPTVGSSYAWTAPAGTTIHGNGNASVTIDWGSTGGNVTATETTAGGCVGSPVLFGVTVTGNHVPVVQNFSLDAESGISVRTDIIGGKPGVAPSDPDGDPLTVSAVGSAVHGTTSTDGGAVTYTASGTYTGGDSFTYTVSDVHGGTAQGTVTVTVTAASSGYSPNYVTGSASYAAGTWTVKFMGIPGVTYGIERKLTVGGSWTRIGSETASDKGLITVTDSGGASESYYRTVYP